MFLSDAKKPQKPFQYRNPSYLRFLRVGFVCVLSLSLLGSLRQSGEAHQLFGKKRPKKREAPAKPNILLFPIDTKNGLTEDLSQQMVALETSRLATDGKYHVTPYHYSTEVMKRAVGERMVGFTDVQPPYNNNLKAKKLGQIMGCSFAMVSVLDDYQYDADKKVVKIVMSIRILDISGEKPKVLQSMGQSYTSPKNASEKDDERTIAQKATLALTDTLLTSLLKPTR